MICSTGAGDGGSSSLQTPVAKGVLWGRWVVVQFEFHGPYTALGVSWMILPPASCRPRWCWSTASVYCARFSRARVVLPGTFSSSGARHCEPESGIAGLTKPAEIVGRAVRFVTVHVVYYQKTS